MANHDNVDVKRAGDLAKEIVALLLNESPEVRRRAVDAAFVLLGESGPSVSAASAAEDALAATVEGALATLFNREALKPADHAQLCAAYHYSLHGPVAFSLDDLRNIAAEAGVILPDRLDKTLAAASKGGRRLFQSAGKSLYKPTAAAGMAFKERWAITPGRRPKTTSSR